MPIFYRMLWDKVVCSQYYFIPILPRWRGKDLSYCRTILWSHELSHKQGKWHWIKIIWKNWSVHWSSLVRIAKYSKWFSAVVWTSCLWETSDNTSYIFVFLMIGFVVFCNIRVYHLLIYIQDTYTFGQEFFQKWQNKEQEVKVFPSNFYYCIKQ